MHIEIRTREVDRKYNLKAINNDGTHIYDGTEQIMIITAAVTK